MEMTRGTEHGASGAPETKLEEPRRRRARRLGSKDPIREAAARLFLERGYAATSMDEVATAAQVSKQTIYTHFANKEELFADLVLGNAGRASEFGITVTETVSSAPDVEEGLRRLARTYIRFVIRPEVVRLRRLVIGEAGRFPELARRYFETVVESSYGSLADLFQSLAEQGTLSVPDSTTAAHQFAWLTLGWLLDRAMFCGDDALVALDLDTIADDAVRVFLAAYATTAHRRGSPAAGPVDGSEPQMRAARARR